MKNKVLTTMTTLGLFFMLAIAGIQAQTPSRIEANVPFDFSAGTAKLKAGPYTVKRLSDRTLSLRSADGKTSVIVSAPLAIESRNSKAMERLVFNQYGDEYFLSQVWLSVESGRQLFLTRAESKLAEKSKLRMADAWPKRVDVSVRIR
jgi:hypothetical protein